jgi:hypothetical protein
MKKFLLPLYFFGFTAAAQVTDSAACQAYLKKNMEVLDAEKQLPVKLFDATFFTNQLFLFGENHGAAMPLATDLLLFKQLHQKAGVRYYIAEVDDTKAWMLNNYLQTGNGLWLKKVFASWIADTAQWASKENEARYMGLRSFYQQLPAKDKFTILGVDVVQDYSLLKEHIQFYRSGKNTAAVKLLTDSLLSITDTITFAYRKQLGAYCRRLVQYISADEKQYRQAFGSYFTAFRHTVASLSFLGAGMYRDSIMFRNFQSLAVKYPLADKKMYGFLGYYHTLQISYDGRPPFAAHLQAGSALRDKIVSIQMQTIDCTSMLPYMAQLRQMMPASFVNKLRQDNPYFPVTEKYIPFKLSNDDAMMKVAGINNLKAVSAPNTATIFRLNNTGSPYNAGRQLMETTGFQTLKPTSEAAVTTQAFQYVLLYRNSKAALPIK